LLSKLALTKLLNQLESDLLETDLLDLLQLKLINLLESDLLEADLLDLLQVDLWEGNFLDLLKVGLLELDLLELDLLELDLLDMRVFENVSVVGLLVMDLLDDLSKGLPLAVRWMAQPLALLVGQLGLLRVLFGVV
jgi:hypothetical protein